MDAPSGNVTAILGKGALLNCRVRGIGNRTVGELECSEVLAVDNKVAQSTGVV